MQGEEDRGRYYRERRTGEGIIGRGQEKVLQGEKDRGRYYRERRTGEGIIGRGGQGKVL